MSNEVERTFIMVKPDGVQRGLVSTILKRFERRGYKLVGLKMCSPNEEHFKKHYEDLQSLPFFPKLLKYMLSGPVVATVWEGTNVVKTARKMMGETKPLESCPGTIRGDFCIDVGRNIIHGSDSTESAKKEIALWFKDDELFSCKGALDCMIYEQ